MFSILITFPYALGVPGGGTRDCIQTAIHLRAAGAEVIIVAVNSHTVSRYPRPQTTGELLGKPQVSELRAGGVEVFTVQQNRLHYFFDGLAVRSAVAKVITARKVDVVLGWHQETAFLPNFLRRQKVLFGMIATNGHYDEWCNSTRGLRKIARNLFVVKQLQAADIIFARSNFMRNLVSELFTLDAKKVHVAHCGVDPFFMNLQPVVSDELTRFLFFGWLIPEKGIIDTLQALGKIAAHGNRNWTLKIAGWGNHEWVRKVAREQNIAEQITLLGNLDRAELKHKLGWAQLAILPSHAESFGLAAAEAQSAGLPVVAYDVGGIPEIIKKNQTGWLVPPGDVNQLANAITAAVQNPREAYKMGLAGREQIRNRFTWQQTAESMLSRLEALQEERGLSREETQLQFSPA